MVDVETLRDMIRDADRARLSHHQCKVCGNVPDADGALQHGRGCYTQNENGGGTSYVNVESDPMLDAMSKLVIVYEAALAWRHATPRDDGGYGKAAADLASAIEAVNA